MLFQDAIKHTIKPRQPATHVRLVKLKRQNRIVPGNLLVERHDAFPEIAVHRLYLALRFI